MIMANLTVSLVFCILHILAIPVAAYLLRNNGLLLSVAVLALFAPLSLWIYLFRAAYIAYKNSRPK